MASQPRRSVSIASTTRFRDDHSSPPSTPRGSRDHSRHRPSPSPHRAASEWSSSSDEGDRGKDNKGPKGDRGGKGGKGGKEEKGEKGDKGDNDKGGPPPKNGKDIQKADGSGFNWAHGIIMGLSGVIAVMSIDKKLDDIKVQKKKKEMEELEQKELKMRKRELERRSTRISRPPPPPPTDEWSVGYLDQGRPRGREPERRGENMRRYLEDGQGFGECRVRAIRQDTQRRRR